MERCSNILSEYYNKLDLFAVDSWQSLNERVSITEQLLGIKSLFIRSEIRNKADYVKFISTPFDTIREHFI